MDVLERETLDRGERVARSPAMKHFSLAADRGRVSYTDHGVAPGG